MSTLHKNISYILLVLIIAGVGYYVRHSLAFLNTTSDSGISIFTQTSPVVDSTSPSYDPFSCTVDPKIGTSTDIYTKGYKLYKARYYGYPDQGTPCRPLYEKITYVDDGTVSSGEYKGYHRVFAFTQAFDEMWMSEDIPSYFITKDFKEFKLVKKGLATDVGTGEDDLKRYINENLDTTRVTGIVDSIEFSHPDILTFGNTEYSFIGFERELSPIGRKLGSIDGLDIFEVGIKNMNANLEYATSTMREAFKKLPAYYSALTRVKVKNKDGVVADYEISFKQTSKEQIKTSRGVEQSKQLFIGGMFFGDEIATKEKVSAVYGQITPTPCGGTFGSYVVKNISQSELRSIGKLKSGVEIFTLKDIHHPLINAQYEEKVVQYDDETFTSINQQRLNITKKPSYSEYASGNPVLIFKDAWGRFVAVGETEYMLEAGCGKPVIYLYPQETTKVHVEFKDSVQLTTHIPVYKKGWDVIAEKTGVLHNLVNEDCSVYEKAKHGSEYAHDACVANEYPYIYWAGNAYREYPTAEEGFVVTKENLKTELESKLGEIGLKQKEIDDMVSYWYPEMLKKNAPFYRISFFDTETMNQFIPMSVHPKPNSVLRIFLDWEPLSKEATIKPQEFKSFNRNGFTYVEWGGLKR